MPPPVTTIHPPSDAHQFLFQVKQYLPVSLPLYRRLQFGNFTSTAYIVYVFSETFDGARISTPTAPWLLAYVDRARRPETEIFLFASWETLQSDPEIHKDESVKSVVRSFVQAVSNQGSPTLPDDERINGAQEEEKVVLNAYSSQLADVNICLAGSVHETTARVLRDLDVLCWDYFTPGEDGLPEDYNKWLFDLGHQPADEPSKQGSLNKERSNESMKGERAEEQLPEGLFWGRPTRIEDYKHILSRTSIPRQIPTLMKLPSVAIFPSDPETNADVLPIAWAFLSVDGSLSTLHVETEYRGKGLAKAVARKLWEDGLEGFRASQAESEERWSHSDVALDNVESNAVCKSLGGRTSYRVYWLRLRLGTTK